MAAIETQTKIRHPFRVATADTASADQLWEMLSVIKSEAAQLHITELELRKAIGLLSQGETKTRRVIGDGVRLKLTYPNDSWTQSILKELVKEDPEQSELYLRVNSYAPNLKEVKKLETASGNERFESYKAKLLSARVPSTSPPTVTLEEK